MDAASSAQPVVLLQFAVVAMLVMFALAGGLIAFFTTYQRRLLKQQAQLQAQREAHQKELLRASLESQENEQRRMAHELHDGVGALLSTSRLYLQQLRLQPADPDAPQWLAKADELLRSTVGSIRTIAQNLRPAELEAVGLAGALEGMAQQVHRSGQIEVVSTIEPVTGLSQEAELLLYRIAQELLNNCIKHAQATTITVTLTASTHLATLTVADNGIGFAPKQDLPTKQKGGMGLKTLESRTALLNGTLKWQTAPDQGTSTTVSVPLNQPSDD